MNSDYRRRLVLLIFASFLVLVFAPIEMAKSAGPGVSLRVVDSKLDDKAERGKLWIKAKPGGSSYKTLAITNSTGARQKISLNIVPALVGESGKLVEQENPDIDLSEIVTFSPRNFVLAPREIRQVKITLRPNVNSKLDFWDALVLVNSSSTSRSNSSDGIVSLPIKFDVKYPAKIGIGNFDQLSYIFSVEDIRPSTSKTFEKLLSVSLKNQGNIPMIFMGQARMVSVDFSNLSFGPYTFRSKTTDPKSERVVNILLPRDLPEGSYRIFVDVNNGKRSSQSVREVTLLFEKPTSLKEKLLLTFIFVAAALILSIAIFYLYRGVLPPFLLQIRHLLKTTKSRDNDNTQYQKELHTNSDLPRFGHLNDKSNSVSSIFVDETDRVPKTSVARKGSVKVSKKKRAIKKQTRSPRRPSR